MNHHDEDAQGLVIGCLMAIIYIAVAIAMLFIE